MHVAFLFGYDETANGTLEFVMLPDRTSVAVLMLEYPGIEYCIHLQRRRGVLGISRVTSETVALTHDEEDDIICREKYLCSFVGCLARFFNYQI